MRPLNKLDISIVWNAAATRPINFLMNNCQQTIKHTNTIQHENDDRGTVLNNNRWCYAEQQLVGHNHQHQPEWSFPQWERLHQFVAIFLLIQLLDCAEKIATAAAAASGREGERFEWNFCQDLNHRSKYSGGLTRLNWHLNKTFCLIICILESAQV